MAKRKPPAGTRTTAPVTAGAPVVEQGSYFINHAAPETHRLPAHVPVTVSIEQQIGVPREIAEKGESAVRVFLAENGYADEKIVFTEPPLPYKMVTVRFLLPADGNIPYLRNTLSDLRNNNSELIVEWAADHREGVPVVNYLTGEEAEQLFETDLGYGCHAPEE